MSLRRKQNWICFLSLGSFLLMLYTYNTVYPTSFWDTQVQPNVTENRLLISLSGSNEVRNGSINLQRSPHLPMTESAKPKNDTTKLFSRTSTIMPSNVSNGSAYSQDFVNIKRHTTRKSKKLYLMTEDEYLKAKKLNHERRQHIKRACESFKTVANRNVFLDIVTGADGNFYRIGGKPFLPQAPYASSFQVDWPDEVVFCWQYKVGSTAWNAMFAHLLNQTNVIKGKYFYNMREIMAVKDNQMMQKAMRFYKFMIVRDPFERLLSAYRDRIEDTSHASWQREHFGPKILAITQPALKEYKMRINGKLAVIPSFGEFVKYLLRTSLNEYDPHWAPYWKHCVPCIMNYNAIGRSETQAQDIQFILEDSGLARKVDAKILEENAHQGRGNTKQLMIKYYSTLSLENLEMLYRRYEIDFLLFNYTIQPLLDSLFPSPHNVTFRFSVR